MRTRLLSAVVVLVWCVACGDARDEPLPVVTTDDGGASDGFTTTSGDTSSDTTTDGGASTGAEMTGGESTADDTTGDATTGDDTTGADDTTEAGTTTGQTADGTGGGTSGGGTTDGGTTGEAIAGFAGVYQGSHNTNVDTDAGIEAFTGALSLKVREDGVFSGKGDATGQTGATATLSVKGNVDATTGAVTASVTWTWADGPAPKTLDANGTLTDEPYRMTLTWKGGDQAVSLDGSVLLNLLLE